jgi:F-type H+-transporting ATPase subunit alpha
VPLEKVAEFEKQLLQLLHARHQADVMDVIASGKLTDDVTEKITKAAQEIAGQF